MFSGFGFGVGVTLTELHPPMPSTTLPPGVVERPGRLHELLPSDALTDAELAREIERAGRVESMVAAYKAERIVALAARRPAAADPGPETPGATAERNERLDPGIAEFFSDELAVILNCSRTAATLLCDTATTLLQRLPATWTALADGSWTGRGPGRSPASWAGRPGPPHPGWSPRWRPRCCRWPPPCRCPGCGRRSAASCWPGTPWPLTPAGGRPSIR